MNSIMPPPAGWQVRNSHPSKPVMGDDEDYVEYICRTADHWTTNPPAAPDGFELIECSAEPRHFPIYMPVDDDLYPGHCLFCERDDLSRANREQRCRLQHRRWKSWKGWSRIASRLYTLGITSSGGGTSFGRCEFCGVGRQQIAPRWRGKRHYILGIKRETWRCLLKYHHRRTATYITAGLCSKCCPCPDCGSTDADHYVCGVRA